MILFRINIKDKILYVLLAVISLTGCGRKPLDGFIIITESETKSGNPDYITGESWRYIPKSRLLAINPAKPEKSPEILTADFYSACSPEISSDGTHMLFAGQKKQNDPWQIWEMELGSSKTTQITNSSDNSIDPAYLPGNRLVFSRSSGNDSLRAGHILYTSSLDGTGLTRITFNPHTYFASSVLKDGRIITLNRQVFPTLSGPSITVLRPDGTKAELFYKGSDGSELCSRGRETVNGKLVFIESIREGSVKKLVSVNYSRPLHSRMELASSLPGDYQSVYPVNSGKLLVSFRQSDKDFYSLYEFDPEKMTIDSQVYKSTEGDILEAVAVEAHERPKKLPSEVDYGVKTGLILCQNLNVTGLQSPESEFNFAKADRVEIMGIDSSLGVIKAQKDGSVFLKVAADMPFRIITKDKDNKVIGGPGSWLYLRPNERRGCVGCHEDQEIVPSNRYSLAVGKLPVPVPVHYSGVKEKDVELE
jgi:hypothetical protein